MTGHPMSEYETTITHHTELLGGMTLRDWFAGQALAAIVSSADQRVAMQNVHAKSAYAYADAMLTERSKTGERS